MNRVASIVLALSAATPLAAAGAEPEVVVDLNRSRIYEGESVRYQVMLNHVENPSPPQLQGFDDFDVAPLGEQSLNSRQITIINGRRSEVVRFGRAYNYQLTPRRSGRLKIPAPTAVVDGKVVRGRELFVDVIAPGDQDVVRMQITAEPVSVYPTQPFTVTLTVAVRELPGRYADQDPTTVQSDPPMLTIPWVDDDKLPKGLQPVRSWQHWLEPWQDRGRGGFGVNNLGSRSVFSLFDDHRYASFYPQPQKTLGTDNTAREAVYWQYQFKRRFLPQQIGQYRFGPVTLKGTFAADVDSLRGLRGEDIYAVAPAIEVTVKEVPKEGRPDSYIGAVGEFQLGAELKPQKVKVGDPMTLTLTLRGSGSLDDANPPELTRLPAIAKQFKIYTATQKTEGGTAEFTYSLRPRIEGIQEFPSVEVSYFDVDNERYVTLHSDPIPIQVSKAVRLAGNQIVAGRRGTPGGEDDLEVRREGIFANVADLSAVRNESIRPGRWLAGLAGAAGAYGAVALVIWQLRRRGGDQALRRRRWAASRARVRLQEAETEMHARRARQAADCVQAALTGLVADMADLPEAGLTPRDVQHQLRAMGVDNGLAERVHTILQACDAARYATSDNSVGHLVPETEALLTPLLKSLKTKRRFSRCEKVA